MRRKKVTLPVSAVQDPTLARLTAADVRSMLAAGQEVLECRRVLERGELNFVSEMLRGEGPFVEYEHYPQDDVYDAGTGAQYYYHAHRGGAGEHGHFHTFLRPAPGCGCSAQAADAPAASATTHLIAISMDAYGWPIGLFATNRWVTDEVLYPADTVLDMIPRFRVEHARPSWPVNRWIGAMLVLFRPHIEALLIHRDYVLAEWERAHPGVDVLEDRELEITGYLPISVDGLLHDLRRLATERAAWVAGTCRNEVLFRCGFCAEDRPE